jgi:hypothetical protein
MTLEAAHRGYEYQDLLTAMRMVDMLLGRLRVTHVDEKLFSGDLFDDLTTIDNHDLRERFQFKHRDVPCNLPIDVLTTPRRDLKLDAVLASALQDRLGPEALKAATGGRRAEARLPRFAVAHGAVLVALCAW